MNFDFSDDSKLLREQAQRFLREQCTPKVVRHVLEGHAPYSEALWLAMAEMGWLGAAIPDRYEGAGLGYEALCVLAEELGRVLAPVPFLSTVCLAAEAILAAGSEAQTREYLPKIVRGELIATFALAEGPGEPREGGVRVRLADGLSRAANGPYRTAASRSLRWSRPATRRASCWRWSILLHRASSEALCRWSIPAPITPNWILMMRPLPCLAQVVTDGTWCAACWIAPLS